MNEVKNVIGLLCKHLNTLFNLEVKPEHFRLAKFNKTDGKVVELLWTLLKKFVKTNYTDNVVFNVKYHLKLLKYNSLHFFALSDDMKDGSRELLITLAYLIANGELNNIVFDKIKHSPFNQEYDLQRDLVIKINKINYNRQCKTAKDCENLIKWIKGKIYYNENLSKEYSACTDKMLRKLNEGLRENYCKNEIVAIYDEKSGEAYLNHTEYYIKILENHENWLKICSKFWEWMNSVLKERDNSVIELNFDNVEMFENAIKNIKH